MCISLFSRANLLRFTCCSNTCVPFNLHCCFRSLFQSAVVLIASPYPSQLPSLPENAVCLLMKKIDKTQLSEKEGEMAKETMRGGVKD